MCFNGNAIATFDYWRVLSARLSTCKNLNFLLSAGGNSAFERLGVKPFQSPPNIGLSPVNRCPQARKIPLGFKEVFDLLQQERPGLQQPGHWPKSHKPGAAHAGWPWQSTTHQWVSLANVASVSSAVVRKKVRFSWPSCTQWENPMNPEHHWTSKLWLD